MLWAHMTADGIGRLHKIEGIMNQYVYKDILEEHLPKCMQGMPFAVEEIVFQHDRDPKRTAKLFSFLIFHNSKKTSFIM